MAVISSVYKPLAGKPSLQVFINRDLQICAHRLRKYYAVGNSSAFLIVIVKASLAAQFVWSTGWRFVWMKAGE